ncbi:hypothetical protein ElyMa_005023500 [Elysia marginata]|uniref:Uncharacterized protein n=1 Tax=Elysia marginata TaxID=1093978 RepID=A0AAV4J9W8_9GAST|nr:hypothetical protein ElyMa_005023500 [Elysia marginata]
MSFAIDTTNREELLTILKEIVEEDELRIITERNRTRCQSEWMYPRNSFYHQHRNTTMGQSKPSSFHNLFRKCSKRYQECGEQLAEARSLYAL